MGITYGALALSALLAIALVAIFGRLRSVTTQLAQTQKNRDELQREVRSLAERERKASARLEERTTEVQSLKKDLGGQKKRAFSMTEELKSLREQVKSAEARAQKLEVSKPAFSEPAKKPTAPSPTATAAPAPDDRLASMKARIEELEANAATLHDDTESQRSRLRQVEGELKKAKSELRRSKRRVDEYRRADLVARSRSELTDDKVRHLGRRYYDAVSELAALKGEVAPPPPRELDELRRDAAEVERAPVRSAVDDPQTAVPELNATESASSEIETSNIDPPDDQVQGSGGATSAAERASTGPHDDEARATLQPAEPPPATESGSESNDKKEPAPSNPG